jgi:tripartite-type tricarboxylate transporter receptor subunit TctC
MMAGVDMVHVPYRGDAPTVGDLIDGQVQVMFGVLPSSIEHSGGKLRALAVTSTARSDALPDIPMVENFVEGYQANGRRWRTQEHVGRNNIIAKLNAKIKAALAGPKLKGRLAELGATPLASSSAAFAKLSQMTRRNGRGLPRRRTSKSSNGESVAGDSTSSHIRVRTPMT